MRTRKCSTISQWEKSQNEKREKISTRSKLRDSIKASTIIWYCFKILRIWTQIQYWITIQTLTTVLSPKIQKMNYQQRKRISQKARSIKPINYSRNTSETTYLSGVHQSATSRKRARGTSGAQEQVLAAWAAASSSSRRLQGLVSFKTQSPHSINRPSVRLNSILVSRIVQAILWGHKNWRSSRRPIIQLIILGMALRTSQIISNLISLEAKMSS